MGTDNLEKFYLTSNITGKVIDITRNTFRNNFRESTSKKIDLQQKRTIYVYPGTPPWLRKSTILYLYIKYIYSVTKSLDPA